MHDTIIIIPVINELKNLKKIIKKIFLYYKGISILIIDDNSDDGTDIWIKSLNKKKLHYIRRTTKLGIGDAHTTGILWAYKNGFIKAITMDGDLSHNPLIIQKFIKKSKLNFELLFSNRYVKNKNQLKGWPLIKKAQSKFAHFLIMKLFNNDYDITNGLRLYNLKKIPIRYFKKLKKFSNYEFFLVSGIIFTKNLKVSQIFINMPYRARGDSKMNIKHIIIWFFSIIRLKFFSFIF